MSSCSVSALRVSGPVKALRSAAPAWRELETRAVASVWVTRHNLHGDAALHWANGGRGGASLLSLQQPLVRIRGWAQIVRHGGGALYRELSTGDLILDRLDETRRMSTLLLVAASFEKLNWRVETKLKNVHECLLMKMNFH